MRTTIELTDRQRAKLLEIAARRGEKGFSHLVREAVERYLDQEAYRRELLDQARSVLGSLSDGEADELDASVRQIRETGDTYPTLAATRGAAYRRRLRR